MLYAVLAQRKRRNPFAMEERKITENISLIVVNVKDRSQILSGLNYIFKKLIECEFEPELAGSLRQQKLENLAYLIRRVKRAGERTTLWENARGALVKRGFPREKLEDLIWA